MWLPNVVHNPAKRYFTTPSEVKSWRLNRVKHWWGSGKLERLGIIYHFTRGRFPSDYRVLHGDTARQVTCHFYIDPEGGIHQFVDTDHYAWCNGLEYNSNHAKKHILTSRYNPNVTCISIEISNIGDLYQAEYGPKSSKAYQPYPTSQVYAVTSLTRQLCDLYAIPVDNKHLVRHSDLDTWKYDPGPKFPLTEIIHCVKGDDVLEVAELEEQVQKLKEQLAPKEWQKNQYMANLEIAIQALNRAGERINRRDQELRDRLNILWNEMVVKDNWYQMYLDEQVRPG